MFKFLHAADIHLDSPLRGLDRYEGAPGDEIRRASRKALENLVRLAIDQKVAFVLIAGDVYDGDWKDFQTGLWFVARMADLRQAGIPVFLIRGNHDARSKMTRDLRLPPNVTSLDVNRPQTCQVDHLPVLIHGQGFAEQSVTHDLAAGYPPGDPGCFNLGLLHTSVNGREGHDRYAPCTVESLRLKNYGYWALGHVHTREILDDRDGPIVFPGNIQGRHIRESGAKGCVIVTVDGHQVSSTEFHALDVFRWATCRIDASSAREIDDVLRGFEEQIPTLLDGADGRTVAVRVEVVGASACHDRLAADHERWSNEIRAQALIHGSNRLWVEAVKLRTRPLKAESEVSLDGPRGELERLLQELARDEKRLAEFAGRELADLRKKIPAELRGADRIDLDGPDWLRSILGQVGPLLSERFEASRVTR